MRCVNLQGTIKIITKFRFVLFMKVNSKKIPY